jgi:hypothetical protein
MVGFFFYFFWVTSWFTVTEVWAAGFGVAAAMCLARKWWIPSLLLLTAAVAAREFMVVLIPAWLLAWWFSNRRSGWWFPVATVLGPFAVLGAHFLAVPRTIGTAADVRAWLLGGPAVLVAALRFGFDEVPSGPWVSLAISAAAIASAFLARPRWRMAALAAATVLPTLFLLTFSGGMWHYYWGAFYTPLAIAIAPGVFGRVLPPPADVG